MKEYDTYRIELTGDECEEIVKNHINALLVDKGYKLDYVIRNSGEYFPAISIRGIKEQQ